MTERILYQTAESYVLCDGRTHQLCTDDGISRFQGVCGCPQPLPTVPPPPAWTG